MRCSVAEDTWHVDAREEYLEKLQAAYTKTLDQARSKINEIIDGSLCVLAPFISSGVSLRKLAKILFGQGLFRHPARAVHETDSFPTGPAAPKGPCSER